MWTYSRTLAIADSFISGISRRVEALIIDGKRSAQFEHSLAITEDGVEILTAL